MNDFLDGIIIALCAGVLGAALHSIWNHWRKGTVEKQFNK